jgi:putative diacylglycerol kinase
MALDAHRWDYPWSMTWQWWLTFILAFAALGISLHNRASIGALKSRLTQAHATASEITAPQNSPASAKTVAVIVNPTKVMDMWELKTVVERIAADAGYSSTLWFGTTPEDPGIGQVRAAIAERPAVVVAAGGDGTVRAVAGQLAGTDIPLGILPLGTGNLLARNLNLPLSSPLSDLATVALTGRPRRIDVGRISAPEPTEEQLERIARIDPSAKPFAGREPFLVIAGMGFDADVMNDADHGLKHSMGWGAYLVSGFKFMRRSRVKATVVAGDATNGFDVEARSILFANCTRLPAGFVLAPDARIDDGWLDLVLVDTKGWIFGWGDVIRRMGLHGIGVRKKVLPSVGSIDWRRMRSVTVATEEPEFVEADGDTLGYASNVTAEIERWALTVHVL